MKDVFQFPFKMKWSLLSSTVLFSCFLFQPSNGCWGPTGPGYGDATPDYDLLVGSDLIVDCTLKAESVFPGVASVDSSHLRFKKGGQSFPLHTHVISRRTAQLRIPNAQVDDSGTYHCSFVLPDSVGKSPHVCSTLVSVGYAPRNVSNFNCISRNFDNLTCSWSIEPNAVKTNYSLQKNLFSINTFQNCPMSNNTSCQWRDDTDPPYQTSSRDLVFVVKGNNSLGFTEQEFRLNHFEIVIPNSPTKLIGDVAKHSIRFQWDAPEMKNIFEKPPLSYEIMLQELGEGFKNKTIFSAGVDTYNFTLDSLIPNFEYSVSVRCRSNYTKEKEMWSFYASLVLKTASDVPHITPEINADAFELYNYENHRNITLYWKPVSERFHNGGGFHYRIVYFPSQWQNEEPSQFVKSFHPYVKLGNLKNDLSYTFHIYSANSEGISKAFQTIVVDERNKLAPSPGDIRAISHDAGFYNLTWSMKPLDEDFKFTVFWCSSRKPNVDRCNGPIYWLSSSVASLILNSTDPALNYQFGIAAVKGNSRSGIQWIGSSCIVPSKAPLGKIPITYIERKTSTSLKVFWKLDCDSQKSLISRYEIIYCVVSKHRNCSVAKTGPNAVSYILQNLQPYSNYSIKVRAYSKENGRSEDMEKQYATTLPGAPSDPPQNVSVISMNNSALEIQFQPPTEPNGVITHYIVHYNDRQKRIQADPDLQIYDVEITGLNAYMIYNVTVVACVQLQCSLESPAVTVMTHPGEPGPMESPRVESVNETHVRVSWTPPSSPNGPSEIYIVRWQQEGDNETHTILVPNEYSTLLDIQDHCSNLINKGVAYLFSVQAINERNGTTLLGSVSQPTRAMLCVVPLNIVLIVGIIVGCAIALTVLMLFMIKGIQWFQDMTIEMKNVAVKLPKELEGPEMNPLKNYVNFKNGLNAQNVHNNNNNAIRLSYAIDETDSKNRHGSGSSQFSNSSSEELIFKNTKNTKYGRKPSGDSSGCSSVSSNIATRVHLSSDSGTESDFAAPPSPDSGISELLNHGIFKLPMPILMEIQDSSEDTSKPEHPYSKFGVTGCTTNPLVFYSHNLANSEPSFLEKEFPVMPSYSKVGLAKSSGDILNVRPRETGYSKYGLANKCYTIDVDSLNPTVGVAMVDCHAPNDVWDKKINRSYNSHFKPVVKTGAKLPIRAGYVPYNSAQVNKQGPCIPLLNSIPCSAVSNKHTVSSQHAPHASLEKCTEPSNTSSAVQKCELNVNSHQMHSTPKNYKFTSNAELGMNLDMSLGTLMNREAPLSAVKFSMNPHMSSGTLINNEPPLSVVLPKDFDSVMGTINSFDELKLFQTPVISSDSPINAGVCKASANEVTLAPVSISSSNVTARNGYVPFTCATLVSVPNADDISSSIFPSDSSVNVEKNHVTPSFQNELKYLQDFSRSNAPLCFVGSRKNDTDTVPSISGSLKYGLKTLPRIESEICEV